MLVNCKRYVFALMINRLIAASFGVQKRAYVVFALKQARWCTPILFSISRMQQAAPSIFTACTASNSTIQASMETTDDNQDVLLPPAHVEGMKTLNRDAFQKVVKVPYVCIPANKTKSYMKKLKPVLLKLKGINPVTEKESNKLVLLNPNLTTEIRNALKDTDLPEVSWTDVTLTYDNWNYSTIFKSVLPRNVEGVSGFSIVGHIIHLNLKDHLQDYKHLIGEVLLDKHKRMKTVVNKVNTIDGKYRNFEMEVLAGESKFKVHTKENGCCYEFDFAKVFWNPRLCTEHASLTDSFSSGDIVFDVFAGVGPFAVLAAKKRCVVYANDLNPDSYKWLCHNAELNKVKSFITAYNLDGKDFICTVIRDELAKVYREKCDKAIHVIMNLPASAVMFLDSFRNLLESEDIDENTNMPTLYCYFFEKSNTEGTHTVINEYLDKEMQEGIKSVQFVRNIAPHRHMYRLTFTITKSVLFKQNESIPPAKKIKCDTC